MKERVHRLLTAGGNEPGSRRVSQVLVTLILLNVAAVVLGTVPELEERYGRVFGVVETVSVLVFTVEYLLRLWSCTANPRFGHPVLGRLRWMVTPMALVDLVAILPFYLPRVVEVDLRMFRLLRLMRILSLLKLGRYSRALQTVVRVVDSRKNELAATLMLVSVLLLVCSSLMYYAERHAQPETFRSIPHAMWWGIVTLSTVGYGDVVPVTALGRLLGAAVALLGIGMFALPAGILGSAFVDEIRRTQNLDE